MKKIPESLEERKKRARRTIHSMNREARLIRWQFMVLFYLEKKLDSRDAVHDLFSRLKIICSDYKKSRGKRKKAARQFLRTKGIKLPPVFGLSYHLAVRDMETQQIRGGTNGLHETTEFDPADTDQLPF